MTSSAIVDVSRDERLFLGEKRGLTGGLRVLPRVKETAFANPRFEKSMASLQNNDTKLIFTPVPIKLEINKLTQFE